MVPALVQSGEGEADQAGALIVAMTRDDLAGPESTDGCIAALREVIEAEQEGHRLPEATKPTARAGQLVDPTATLQRSTNKAQAARGNTNEYRRADRCAPS